LIIPLVLYGLYIFSYPVKKIPSILHKGLLWSGTLFAVVISTLLSLYFEFETGNYLTKEAVFISINSLIIFLPYGYVLHYLSKQFKKDFK